MLRKWLHLYHSATWGELVDAIGTIHSLTNIVSKTTEGLLLLCVSVCVYIVHQTMYFQKIEMYVTP